MTVALSESAQVLDSLVVSYTGDDNLDIAYQKFLKEVYQEQIDWNLFYSDDLLFNKIISNDLGFINEFVLKANQYTFDRVFNSIEIKYLYQPKNREYPINTFVIGYGFNMETKTKFILVDENHKQEMIDSIGLTILNEIQFYNNNKVFECLRQVSENKPVLKTYLEAKETMDMIKPNLKAGGIGNENCSNYFVKRILAIEFLIYRICYSID